MEMAGQMTYYLAETIEYDEKSASKFLTSETLPVLGMLRERLDTLDDFSHDGLEGFFKALCEEKGLKLKNLAQPARVALTGGTASPGIYELIEVMGKPMTLHRLDAAMQRVG